MSQQPNKKQRKLEKRAACPLVAAARARYEGKSNKGKGKDWAPAPPAGSGTPDGQGGGAPDGQSGGTGGGTPATRAAKTPSLASAAAHLTTPKAALPAAAETPAHLWGWELAREPALATDKESQEGKSNKGKGKDWALAPPTGKGKKGKGKDQALGAASKEALAAATAAVTKQDSLFAWHCARCFHALCCTGTLCCFACIAYLHCLSRLRRMFFRRA